MIVVIGEETKGYRVYLPGDKVVVTTQHVSNIETLNELKNKQLRERYLDVDDSTGRIEPDKMVKGRSTG